MANTDRSFSYSAKAVSVILGAVRVTGWAKDSLIDITYNSAFQDLEVGADGTGIRSQSNDNSAKVTLRLLQNSPANKTLTQMLHKDLADNDSIVSLEIKDPSNGTKHTASGCWVMKAPKKSYHGKAIALEWELETDDLSPTYSPDA